MAHTLTQSILVASLASIHFACKSPQPVHDMRSLVSTRVESVKVKSPEPAPLISIGDFPRAWLKARTTIEQAESENLVSAPELGPTPVPFGFIHGQWLAFKQLMQPGDEIWTFSEQGGSGLCIVRSHRIIACLTTIIT